MKISGLITFAALMALLSTRSWPQSPDAASILARDAAIDVHLVKAREAAGFDFTGTLARLCVAPARFPLHGGDSLLALLKQQRQPLVLHSVGLHARQCRDHGQIILDPVMNFLQQDGLLSQRAFEPTDQAFPARAAKRAFRQYRPILRQSFDGRDSEKSNVFSKRDSRAACSARFGIAPAAMR
jgi:hypothetical protein